MAQLKVKQISDFVSAVEAKVNGIVGTETVSAISVAKSEAKADASSDASTKANAAESNAISTAVSADVVVLSSAKSYADEAEADALSNAKVYADSKDVLVLSDAKAYSDIQKLRINALLQDSTTALDTFAEISSFITSLETSNVEGLSAALSTAVSNDAVHATGISDNAGDISSIESTIGAYGDIVGSDVADFATAAQGLLADSALQDASVFDASGSAATAKTEAIAAAALDATSKADTAEGNANDYTDERETAITTAYKAYADTAETDAVASAKTYTDTEISDLDSELRLVIAGVAGVDKVEQIARFDSATTFSVTNALSLENNDILVFVNGLQIHKVGEGVDGFSTADGVQFQVSGLGYDLEGDDHIVVVGVAV